MLHPLRRLARFASRVMVGLWIGDRVRDIVAAAHRPVRLPSGLAAQIYAKFCVWIDQTLGWPNLPPYVGLAVLLGERIKLRLEEPARHHTSSRRCPSPSRQADAPTTCQTARSTAPSTTCATRAWARPTPASAATCRTSSPGPIPSRRS